MFEVIEDVEDLGLLIAREQHWIIAMNACNPRTGFNICPTAGSALGLKRSKEARERMRKPKTEAHRASLSRARMGGPGPHGPKSPEHRAKISAAKMGKRITFSDEARANISAAAAKKNKTQEMREKVRTAKLALYKSPERRAEMKSYAMKRWHGTSIQEQE